jgi:3-hydroxybutyryl-CoA dehydrogenase
MKTSRHFGYRAHRVNEAQRFATVAALAAIRVLRRLDSPWIHGNASAFRSIDTATFCTDSRMSTVRSIAVIGAGTMGSGIALTAAQAGITAIQVDVSSAALDKAKAGHAKSLARLVEKGKLQAADADAARARVTYVTEMAQAKDADWVVEAATENVDVKKAIFRAMQAAFRGDAVLATNTSSISITDLASAVGVDAPRVIGMHFFNPVPIMKLVEVIRGIATSDDTTARTIELAKAMGKTPVIANDRAGFVSNRVLMPMINEAFYAWMEGVAQPADIDQIMQLGCNFPMGPLRLADFIGLDVCHDIMMVLTRELGNPKFFPCPLLRQLVQAGRLGDKSGRGVFEYPAK